MTESAAADDVRALAGRLEHIESVALLPTVPSTNALARRVMHECLENEVPLPSAVIIALEQTAGVGRGGRTWSSPAGKGIWATILHTRDAAQLPLLPLEVAVAVATLLRDEFGVDARIKWPNDVLVDSAKIAGILIEARARDSQALVLIGIGINVFPVGGAESTSSIEQASGSHPTLEAAIARFAAAVDRDLFLAYDPERILSRWRELALHRDGDRIAFALGDERVEGTWEGIDDAGRARVRTADGTRLVAAGDLIAFT